MASQVLGNPFTATTALSTASIGRLHGWSIRNSHATEDLVVTFRSGGATGTIIGEVILAGIDESFGSCETVYFPYGVRFTDGLHVTVSATGTCSGVAYMDQ